MKLQLLIFIVLFTSTAFAQEQSTCTFVIPKEVKKVEGSGNTYPVFITTSCPYKEVTVTVYNRWGNELYTSNNLNHDWKGKETTSGTYFVTIRGTDVDNKQFNVSGYTTFLE